MIPQILQDMKSGFSFDRERLYNASKNLDYFQGRFQPHWRASEEGDEQKPRRTVILASHIVNTICNVNKVAPTRVVNNDGDATDFLGKIYNDNKMYAKFLAAERLSCVSQVAAFQVAASDDADHPIKIHLWSADSLVVYTSPDDPTVPEAVVTIDKLDGNTKRYQVWTAQHYQSITSINVDGTHQWNTDGLIDNPYGKLPFAFAHWQTPSLDFYPGSPGDNLTVANDYVNRRLSKIGAAQEFLCEPVRVVKNGKDFNPGKYKPGEYIVIEAEIDDATGKPKDVEIEDIQPDYTFSEAGWNDVISYIDLTLETHGVPLSATRMVQSTGRSGVSIMMEQWPLAVARVSRQPLWRDIEHQLAQVVFHVAAVHLRDSELLDISKNLDLTVTYPEVFMEVPGEERDRAHEWELSQGLKSRVKVYQERYGVTREEALAALAQVARDEDDLSKLVAIEAAVRHRERHLDYLAESPEGEEGVEGEEGIEVELTEVVDGED